MSYNTISKSDYTFVESLDSELYGVKLTSGEWEDVIVVYGKVSIKESIETGYATLGFSYQVQDSSSFQPDQLEKDEDFKNYLGDVLSHIINSKEETNEDTIDSSVD